MDTSGTLEDALADHRQNLQSWRRGLHMERQYRDKLVSSNDTAERYVDFADERDVEDVKAQEEGLAEWKRHMNVGAND
ncbi:unnamed protein product, partial [Amoebophrya sp. A25]|eukprot:GSA25T00024705001.1